MIINLALGESRYYTVPPGSAGPVSIQRMGDNGWENYGSIRSVGHRVRLFGESTYRTVIATPGPDCCVIHTETDVVDATPKIRYVQEE